MEQDTDPFAWPQCEGYLTVRALDEQENCKVWLVQRESDQQYRVIKLIGNQEAVASMEQIARVEGAEHLIDFHGVLDTDAGPALLAEYCPGGSLGQMVRARGPLPLGEVITALAPIAQSVEALHRQGIRHGDISPNNILLTAEGMPKLADFQETRLLIDNVNPGGTPGFLAPEVSVGGYVDGSGAADVYALGACLWYLLSGQVPEPPELRSPVNLVVPTAPEQILDLLVESLDSVPEQRPSAEQFARALFASGQAEALNWTSSVPGFATHLMATIHPLAQRGRLRGSRKQNRTRKAPMAAGGRDAAEATETRTARLKRTPGSRKLLVAATAGLVLMTGTGLGVRHMVHSDPAMPGMDVPQTGVMEPVRSCTMQSDAQLPPCAQDQAMLLTELVRLTRARDLALTSADADALARLYTETSEQLVLDLALLDKLEDLGLTIQGLQTSLEQLEVTARGYPDVVVISGESFHGHYSYHFRGEAQAAHQAKAGAGERVRFELQYGQQGWQISRVLQRENESGTVANDDPTRSGETSSRG